MYKILAKSEDNIFGYQVKCQIKILIYIILKIVRQLYAHVYWLSNAIGFPMFVSLALLIAELQALM